MAREHIIMSVAVRRFVKNKMNQFEQSTLSIE